MLDTFAQRVTHCFDALGQGAGVSSKTGTGRRLMPRAAMMVLCALAFLALASPGGLRRRTPTALPSSKQQVAAAQSAGDNAWMLTSSALVLMMTGPGWRSFTADWFARRMCWPR